MRYYLALFFVLLFCGCDKEEAEDNDPEKCQLTSYKRADHIYPIIYEGARIVMVGDGPQLDTRLTYGASGKLARIESPANNPNFRTDLFYNNEGKVSMEKVYQKWGETWLEEQASFYTYTDGKLTGIRKTVQRTSPVLEFDHEVTWEADNIRSIVIRSGTTIVCTQQYSYDMTQKNPTADVIDLYNADNIAPSYELPLYLSANRLIKEENTCPSAQTTNFTYEFTDKNLLKKIYTNGYELISYAYDCH